MGNIIKYQNPSSPLINRVNKSKANFVKRLLDPNRKHIQDWVNPLSISTHKLGWATEDTKQGAFVYPEVQEINGELIDFTHPSHLRSEGMNSAIERRDAVRMTPEQAKWFTENYKQYYPGFKDGGNIHIKPENKGKFTDYCGGKVTQECIQRGKHSSNPTTRKRATFAANARTWKHENGGILKAQFGLSMINPFVVQHQLENRVAPLINEHGKKINQPSFEASSGAQLAAQDRAKLMWMHGDRLSDNYKDHARLVKDQVRKEWYEDPINNRTNAQKAATLSLLGQSFNFAGPWGITAARIASIPDQVYDWAASIAEPTNVRNHVHTAANYLDELAKITPTKYDDYVAKAGELIGNADDIASSTGHDLFDWSKKKKE